MQILTESGFITPRDCAQIIDAFVAYEGAELRTGYMGRRELAARALNSGPLAEIISAIRDRVSSYAGRNLAVEFPMLSEMHVGDRHRLHADAERLVDGKWEPNHTPQRTWTALLYLNECGVDFNGGQLLFPQWGVTVNPKPGLLLASPTTHEYQHEVPEITSGVRYVLAVWLKDA